MIYDIKMDIVFLILAIIFLFNSSLKLKWIKVLVPNDTLIEVLSNVNYKNVLL